VAATAVGKVGQCKLSVTGDADLTSGTKGVSSEVDAEVVPGETVGFQIGMLPTPAPAPAPPPNGATAEPAPAPTS
jgi:hypothetical protein